MSMAQALRPGSETPQSKVAPAVLDKAIEETIRRQTISWQVADSGERLELSISHVRKLFCNPTKKGRMPTDRDCWLFLQLCKARGLNPYLGDAFLVGYDEEDTAKFSLITAHQALLKRAEASGKKRGMQSGVIVLVNETGEEKERVGDFYLANKEELVGAWCKVYRADWDFPQYERIRLGTFNKGYSRWKADPAGMIVKCAEASAHRLAFPCETGGMYISEERAGMEAAAVGDLKQATRGAAELSEELIAALQNTPEAPSVPQAIPPAPTVPETTLDRTEAQEPSPDDAQMKAEMWVAEERDMIAKAAGLKNLILIEGEIGGACKAGIISDLQRDRLFTEVEAREKTLQQPAKRAEAMNSEPDPPGSDVLAEYESALESADTAERVSGVFSDARKDGRLVKYPAKLSAVARMTNAANARIRKGAK